MSPAERKAVGEMVRQASDLYAATMGNKPIYDNRAHMQEFIVQSVEAQMALLGVEGVLAEWIMAANRRAAAPGAPEAGGG